MITMLKLRLYQTPVVIRLFSGTLLSLLLLTSPAVVLAHGGHGNEFKGGGETAQTSAAVEVDAETAKRLGIKVEPAKRQRLAVGIKSTGQIEALPGKQVEVTAPVPGKVVDLLVKPGVAVKQGQPVAVIAAPDLIELGVNSEEKRAEAQANLQQAQADLKLAQQNYERFKLIADSEITQARTQLVAAQSQYERDRKLVDQKALVKVAQENYQRQAKVADAEIAQAKTTLAVAQERYDRDQELVEKGALPRRQMLESQANLEQTKANLAKASSRENVLAAENELKRAEVDLPLRELRDSESKLAETKAALTKALTRRDVLAAEAQLKRAQSSVQVSQSRIRLSNAAYQRRLGQLGSRANSKGLVTVTAPISGKVADREASPGQSFQDAGGKLMTILDDNRVYAAANIYEKDLAKVKIGQRVSLKVASVPDRTFNGKITLINSVVAGETRVVPVKAEIDNSLGVLKPGMFAELEVLTEQTSSAIMAIPSSAVVDANGKKLVYIQNGNAYQTAEVTLGQTSGDTVEVKTGLFEGDMVVTQRASQLYAQSLRGGGKKEEGHSEVEATAQNKGGVSLPWWWVIPSGGALALAAFIVGRRTKPGLVTLSQEVELVVPVTDASVVSEHGASELNNNYHRDAEYTEKRIREI
jgi:membrane fusion protein, heavy metal efflux system